MTVSHDVIRDVWETKTHVKGLAAAKEGDAFRPKVFGKKIIVERLIRRDGSAEYRLKNEHGTLVSKLKNDLDAMLDHLNIQVAVQYYTAKTGDQCIYTDL